MINSVKRLSQIKKHSYRIFIIINSLRNPILHIYKCHISLNDPAGIHVGSGTQYQRFLHSQIVLYTIRVFIGQQILLVTPIIISVLQKNLWRSSSGFKGAASGRRLWMGVTSMWTSTEKLELTDIIESSSHVKK